MLAALMLSACAGGTATSSTAAPDTTSAPTVADSVAETTTTAGEVGAETTTSTRPAPNPDRPIAPDFSLTLSDGTVYEYADEVRPVFMVFWAEW